MVHMTMEIKTTRDIARQILRHRSFNFQEFSQNYTPIVKTFRLAMAELQDTKNRQNSIEIDHQVRKDELLLRESIVEAWSETDSIYPCFFESCMNGKINGVKDKRAILPEGYRSTL